MIAILQSNFVYINKYSNSLNGKDILVPQIKGCLLYLKEQYKIYK